ncbi:hypothetical protein WMO25_10520 [Coprococcus sp. CLA-AA-H190]|uniref:Uncharacterized protein n=1 Tax=Coprococcus intestinihominis TaxID=3133154 RepID=A0ABV1B6E0_9FIRM
MGMFGNAVNQAATDAAAKQQEMQMLLRGKNSEQQAIIKFFYGASGGCMSSGMTVEEYRKKVRARLSSLDTKSMALRKLGIDEDEVQEIAPVTFEGYVFNDKVDNLVARASANTWVSSEYMITWLFFGEREVFIYQYSFSMTSDSKKENTMQYFYQDVTNFTASSETYQKLVAESSGCMGSTQYMQASANADEFKIVVPGDTLRCSMTPTDSTDAAIRGMRNKLREMKNR